MAYGNSISLETANKLFVGIGVSFVYLADEGSYMAKHDDKYIRKKTLTNCVISVINDWMVLK